MDSSNNILEILIKLGYIGADQAAAARSALAGIKEETGDLSESLPEGSKLWEKYKNVLSDTGTQTEKTAGHSREMRRVMGELDRVLPGLGEGFRGLINGMGPMLVLVEGIQAAVTWWNFYEEKVKAVADAQAAALDKMRDATKKLVEENTNFANSLENIETAVQKLNTAYQQGKAVLDAQLKVRENILKADEDAALAAAASPEEKQAIKATFAARHATLQAGGEQAGIDLLGNVIAAATSQLNQRMGEREGLERQATATQDPAERQRLGSQIVEKDKQIEELQKQIDSLQSEKTKNENVFSTERAGRAEEGVFEIIRNSQSRGSVSPDEQNVLTRVASIYAGHQVNLQQSFQILMAIERNGNLQGELLKRILTTQDDLNNKIQAIRLRK